MPENPPVHVRLAHPDDKGAIAQMCQHTWDTQDDYIPLVWDKWMADPCGHILIADLDGQPIGMSRLLQISSNEGWWEGLRVDRPYRKQGIGSLLAYATIEKARSYGLTTLRTCVHQDNDLMLPFVQRCGYEFTHTYALYRADALPHKPSALQPLSLEDLDLAWSALHHFDTSLIPQLFVCQGARWQHLTQDTLVDRIQQGWVWRAMTSGTLQSLFIRSHMDNPDGTLWNGWVGGTSSGLATALHDIRCVAHQLGFQMAGGFFPAADAIAQGLLEAGYQFCPLHIVNVYEQNLLQKTTTVAHL